MSSDDGKKGVIFSKGDYLFRQGETSRFLYIIKKGSARVFKTEETVEVELDIAGPGAVVGEVSAIDAGPRSASVVALEQTEVLRIEADEFQKIVDKLPDWFQKIARILVRRLRTADEKIDMSKGGDRSLHAAALIALLTYTDESSATTGGRYEFALSKIENEIADMLNMSLAEVDVVLKRLDGQKLLTIEHGKVIVADRARLEAAGEQLFGNEVEAPAV